MTIERAEMEDASIEQPVWRRPTLNAVAIAEVTLLGKLGSALDLGGENNYAAD